MTAAVVIVAGPTVLRQGDVGTYRADPVDADGNVVDSSAISWAVVPSSAGFFAKGGRFVGYTPGSANVVASASGFTDTLVISITLRNVSGSFGPVGHTTLTTNFSAHISVYGNYAYTGTQYGYGIRSNGNKMIVWDISDPSNPTITSILNVDSSVEWINRVMVRADGKIAGYDHRDC